MINSNRNTRRFKEHFETTYYLKYNNGMDNKRKEDLLSNKR